MEQEKPKIQSLQANSKIQSLPESLLFKKQEVIQMKIPKCPECKMEMEDNLLQFVGINISFPAWACPKGDIFKLAKKEFMIKWQPKNKYEKVSK